MHDPVTETRRPDLSRLGIGHDKRDTATNRIGAVAQIAPQGHKVALKVGLKRQLMQRVALMAATIEIRIEQGFKRQLGIGIGH